MTRRANIVALVAVAALATLSLASCSRRPEQARSSERTGTRGALRYHLKSEIVPPRVTLGDRATWRLTADFPAGVVIGAPLTDSADSSLDLATIEAPRQSHEHGGTTWSSSFRLSGYTLGRIALPGIRLPVSASVGAPADSLEFPPDTLDVDSLTAAMRGSVEPDRGPLPTELRPIDFAVAAGLALVVLAAILALVHALRSRRAKQRVAGVVAAAPEPADLVFHREIDRLRGEIEVLPRHAFYEALSLAIRRYAAAVTTVPALDRTTSELERELRARGGLDPDAVTGLGRILRRSDLAKFARHEDRLAEAKEMLDEAATIPTRLPPPAAPETAAMIAASAAVTAATTAATRAASIPPPPGGRG